MKGARVTLKRPLQRAPREVRDGRGVHAQVADLVLPIGDLISLQAPNPPFTGQSDLEL